MYARRRLYVVPVRRAKLPAAYRRSKKEARRGLLGELDEVVRLVNKRIGELSAQYSRCAEYC